MSPKKTKNSSTKKESNLLQRIILDLKIKGLSLNEIRSHLSLCHNITISIRKIKAFIVQMGNKARSINGYYDKKALPKIKVAEADEIYQGRDGMYLGVVDKESTYLVSLNQLESKNIRSFQNYFSQFKHSLTSLQLWITDGLPTYSPVLNSVYPDVSHLICHVHTYRDIMIEQDVYNRKAKRKYIIYSKCQKEGKLIRDRLINNQKATYIAKEKLEQLIGERDAFYREHDIKKFSRKKQYKKQRTIFKKKINYQRAYLRSYTKQVNKGTERLESHQEKIKKLHSYFMESKVITLQTGRLVHAFKSLLDSKWDEYKVKEERLIKLYSNSAYPIAKKLLKIIKNKKKIFSDKTSKIQALISSNRANTNTIESIFGKYRLFFKKYRKMKYTTYSKAVFEILRLHHNLSPPYTGPNITQSPVSRVGIRSKFNNCLDRLCGGISSS